MRETRSALRRFSHRRTSVAGIGLASSLGLSAFVVGCSLDPEPGAPPPPALVPPDASTVARGREAYLRYCALCHGARAEGYAADDAPAIGNPDFLRVATDAFLRTAIAEGRPGTPMSAWHRRRGGPLDDDGIEEIIDYLRSLETEPRVDGSTLRVEGDRERGAALYREHCAGCHGEGGEGVRAVSLSSPVFRESATDAMVRETIARGRRGTAMRGWDGILSSEDIDALTLFVRTMPPRVRAPEAPRGAPPPDLDHIVLNPGAERAQFSPHDDRYVPGRDVRAALEAGQRLILIDARAPSDWALAHIPGAVPFPFYDAEQLIAHVPDRETWVIAYCACPHGASGRVVDLLRAAGHARSGVLDEGIQWWMEQGYPTESGTIER